MQRFIIERTVPGIGDYSQQQIADIVQKTRAGLASAGGRIHWQETFVAADKLFSVFIAEDEAALRDFSRSGPFSGSTSTITPVRFVADLTTT